MTPLKRLDDRIKKAYSEGTGLHLHPYEVEVLATYLNRVYRWITWASRHGGR